MSDESITDLSDAMSRDEIHDRLSNHHYRKPYAELPEGDQRMIRSLAFSILYGRPMTLSDIKEPE